MNSGETFSPAYWSFFRMARHCEGNSLWIRLPTPITSMIFAGVRQKRNSDGSSSSSFFLFPREAGALSANRTYATNGMSTARNVSR